MNPSHTAGQPQHESTNLSAGHMSAKQASGLAIASFFPAVGLATVPVFLAGQAGNGAWLSMVCAAIVVICVGRCISVFAKRFVVTGSLYSYITFIFGGWAKVVIAASLAIGYAIALLTVLLPFGLYFGSFMTTLGWSWWITTGGQIVLYTVATLITLFVTYRGLDASVRTGLILLAISLPFMIVILIAVAAQDGIHLQEQLTLSGVSFHGITGGAVIGFAFLLGFEGSTALAAETRDPKRNVPRIIMSVPISLGILYTLGTLIQVPALERAGDAMAAGFSPPAALVQGTSVAFLANIVDLVLAVSIFATLIGFMNYGSRIWATMAMDGLLPARLSRINTRHQTPATAIVTLASLVLVATIALVLISGGTPLHVYELAATLLTYFWVVPYILICIGAVLLLRREGRLSLGLVISAVIGTLASAWIFLSSIVMPGPAPYNVLPYVYLTLTASGIAAFAATIRAFRRRNAEKQDQNGGAGREIDPETMPAIESR